MKKAARSLAFPLTVVALFAVAALYEQEILVRLGVAAVTLVGRVLPYVLHTGIWLSLAYLLNRVVGITFWDPLHERVPVPRLLRDVTALVIYIIAITGIVGVVFHQPIGPFWAASGVGAIVLGLALRNVILDVFIGLAVNFDRPFEIGDYIQLTTSATGGPSGRVIELNWRTTRLLTSDGNMVVIPNGRLGEVVVTNFSRPERVSEFEMSVFLDFDVPTDRALRVLGAAVGSIAGSTGVLEDPAPKARVRAITPQGVEYKIKWFLDPRVAGPGRARHEVIRAVLDQLRRSGLQPATPQQDVFHAPYVRRQLDTGAIDDRTELLGRIPLFAALTTDERHLLAARMRSRLFPEGAELLRSGEAGDSMFIVCEGLLNVIVEVGAGREPTRVARLAGGSYFGELSALTGAPRSATIVAATETLVFEIVKADLAELVALRPELAEELAVTISTRRSNNAEAVRRASEGVRVIEEERSMVAQLVGKMLDFFGVKPRATVTARELEENSAQSPFA